MIAHFDYARACEPLAARLGTTGAELLERFRARGLTRVAPVACNRGRAATRGVGMARPQCARCPGAARRLLNSVD